MGQLGRIPTPSYLVVESRTAPAGEPTALKLGKEARLAGGVVGEPLEVCPHDVEARVGVGARKSPWIAVEAVYFDGTPDVLIVGRPRLGPHALLVAGERNRNPGVTEGLLDLLHVDHQRVGSRMSRLLKLVFDLVQDDGLGG